MTHNQEIPLNIFQTYHTLDLPPRMRKCVNKLIKNNPEFTHRLYDDNDCRQFIKDNFPLNVVQAFDKLIPGAYKADLWRYCVLYIHGGIYLDIKYGCVNNFKLIELTTKEHVVKDQKLNGVTGIYQALMVHKPYSQILHKCISKIVNHASSGYYGHNALMVTGPHLMKDCVQPGMLNNYELEFAESKRCIFYKGEVALRIYKGYRSELNQTQLLPPYYVLWEQRNIYKQ